MIMENDATEDNDTKDESECQNDDYQYIHLLQRFKWSKFVKQTLPPNIMDNSLYKFLIQKLIFS